MDRCHWVTEDGVKCLIPGCMGVAAAMGCGKVDADILSYCTCPRGKRRTRDKEIESLRKQIAKLEQRLDVIDSTRRP